MIIKCTKIIFLIHPLVNFIIYDFQIVCQHPSFSHGSGMQTIWFLVSLLSPHPFLSHSDGGEKETFATSYLLSWFPYHHTIALSKPTYLEAYGFGPLLINRPGTGTKMRRIGPAPPLWYFIHPLTLFYYWFPLGFSFSLLIIPRYDRRGRMTPTVIYIPISLTDFLSHSPFNCDRIYFGSVCLLKYTRWCLSCNR